MKAKYSFFLLFILIICTSFSSVTFGTRQIDVVGSLTGGDNEETGIVEVSRITEITSKSAYCENLGITLKLKGWWIDKYFVSSGNKIYFLACKMKKNKYSNFRLYEYDITTNKYKLLYKMPSKYKEGLLLEIYDGSVYMNLKTKEEHYCLRYYIKAGKLKTLFKRPDYYRYKNYLVSWEKRKGEEFFGAKSNKEIFVYNAKTGKKKSIFKGYAEGLTRIGRYIYYAVSIDGYGLSVNEPSLYKIIRYDLETGKKKTLLKSGKFLEIEHVTDRYVYHQTWYCLHEKYYRYDLKQKKDKKISSDAAQKASETLYKNPDAETQLS